MAKSFTGPLRISASAAFHPQSRYGNGEPDLSLGVSPMLHNNLWGTNYVMWYPYEKEGRAIPGAENIRYRFRLVFDA